MEIKNEVIPVSEEAPVSAEKSATRGKRKTAAADKSRSEKQPATKKPARKTVKKASADATEEEKKEAKPTSENETVRETTPNAETTAPSAPAEIAPVASQKEATEAPKKKSAPRRKTAKTAKAEETTAEAPEVKTEASATAEEKQAEPEKKPVPSQNKRKTAEKKPAAKKAPAKKKANKAAEQVSKTEEKSAEEAPTSDTIEENDTIEKLNPVEELNTIEEVNTIEELNPIENFDPIAELKAVMTEQNPELPVVEQPASVSEVDFTAEEKAAEATVDVSGTPAETFFFMSPGQISAMEEEKARLENEVRAEAAVEAAPEVTEAAKEEQPEKTAESSAPVQEKEEPSSVSEELPQETVKEPETAAILLEEATEAVAEPVVEAAPAETALPKAEEAPAQRRRNDPHQKDVMDKERIRTVLTAFLEEAEEIDRRVLIESTMKQIPLTDEEREDNRPVSLSNRVRSVIGSVLSEMGAAGKIRAVSGGRKLTMRPIDSQPEKEQEETIPEVKEVKEKTEKVKATEKPQKEEIPMTASIDGGTPAVIDFGFKPAEKEEAPETVEKVERTETVEKRVASEPAAPAMQKLRGPKEDEEDLVSEETPIEAESADQEQLSVNEPVVSEPAVHPSVRRVRASSRGDRQPKSAQSGAVVLITEEEIERVILNSVRRNSATKNDILAALKRVYVDPYGLRKEEENRIYTIAGNILQKLLNRNAIQTVDGRYMNKPSHRVLNPGVAQSAYSTGNVETRFINELNRQSGDFFEQFAAKLLEKYFEMSNIKVDASYVVGGSDDNGIDIMIETTDFLGYRERVLVQAKKRATQPVTLKEVREFYGALCAEEGTRGVFITTSSFCMEASKMIGKVRNLIAIDKRKLFALAEHCEVGLYRDEEGRLLLDENLFLEYDV